MQALILAAGESSRFWPLNYQYKVLFKIMGKPLIYYTMEALKKAGIKDIIIVQGPQKEIEEELKNHQVGSNIKYVIQPEPKGMGDAVMKARHLISGPFLVVHGHKVDVGEHLKEMRKKQQEIVLLGVKTNQPWLYGILEINGDKVKSLVEKPEKGKEPSNIKIAGVYLLPPSFFDYYQRVPEHQYSFEDALNLYMKENKVTVAVAEEDFSSLKYPWHLFSLTKYLFDQYLCKKVYLRKNVKILKGAVVQGPCYIGDDCVIGNHALVRDYTNLEESVMVGAQSEVTRCLFQKNVHVHSGYFGDSILGENCRVGAGTVTGNVRLDRGEIRDTGLSSLGAIVGKNSHLGINTSLMPGVLIGSHSAIGPASVVFEDIENNTTFYTEFKNIVKKHKI